ncbi:AP-1 complex subunit beta-1, partial [Coelomomyces lativittatus]
DTDPYVRKTAAICVAKLFDLKPQLTIDNGFITQLQDLLSDSNPMVVANAIAALRDIQTQGHVHHVFEINPIILHKLLAALNECTEWGQICILECLSEYIPTEVTETQSIVDRVVPRLAHINTAVVLAAIRVLLVYMDLELEIGSQGVVNHPTLLKKLTTSLVSLISSNTSPSLTYVALKNVQLIVQKRPDVFQTDLRLFFCQYNDPLFVKLEKLKLLLTLTTQESGIEPVLQELKEYANEVDPVFVKQVVLAMGRLALQWEPAADRCMQALIDIAHLRGFHTYPMCFIAFKDVVRQYPGRFDALMGSFLHSLEPPSMDLDQEESQCAFLWLLAHGGTLPSSSSTSSGSVSPSPSDVIARLMDHVQSYVTHFLDLRPCVQCQLMATLVQWYLHAPHLIQSPLHTLLQKATLESEHPDVRDRAFIYWRLLAHPQVLPQVVVHASTLTSIHWTPDVLPPSLLRSLIQHLGTLASVSHTLPNPTLPPLTSSLLGSSTTPPTPTPTTMTTTSSSAHPVGPPSDPLGLGFLPDDDEEGWVQVVSAEQGQGVEVQLYFSTTPTTVYFQLTNQTSDLTVTEFAVQFNVNTLGLMPHLTTTTAASSSSSSSSSDSTLQIHVPPQAQLILPIPVLVHQPAFLKNIEPTNLLQVAMKTNFGIVYFSVFLPDTWMDTAGCLI